MGKVSFIKVESLGNDFVIVEPGGRASSWSRQKAAKICDRRSGVGADGLILLGPETRDGIRFRLFNADGSRAEWSGNGARGVGAYLAAVNRARNEFHLDTAVGCIRITAERRKAGGVDASFSRPMPLVTVASGKSVQAIASIAERHLIAGPVAVDAGNPHWVFVVSGFGFDWEELGQASQSLHSRTHGINVEFVRVRSRAKIELRIFERGVGPTPSSGSGALAAVAACRAMAIVGPTVRVVSTGGQQTARFSPSGESITLQAPARIVMAGVWSDGDVLAGNKQ